MSHYHYCASTWSWTTYRMSSQIIDELIHRVRWLLDNELVTEPDSFGNRSWTSGDVSVAHSIPDGVIRVTLREPFGVVYAGPETDKYRSYIHVPGIKMAVEILRKHMVLDDLADV